MQFENIRYWFACNSSSTHSVVFNPGQFLTDKLCGNDDNVSGEDKGYFGWEPFIAASKLARKTYLKGLIRHRLLGPWYDDSETGRLVADQLFPGDFPEGGLDHQAIPLIPRKYGTHEPCYAFFREMAAYVLQDGVVIHGGNDYMEGEFPPESNVNWYKAIPKDVTDDNWVCRNEGDWWVLFNQKNGTKVTLSFKDNPEPRVFASVPELVDLKITNPV